MRLHWSWWSREALILSDMLIKFFIMRNVLNPELQDIPGIKNCVKICSAGLQGKV